MNNIDTIKEAQEAMHEVKQHLYETELEDTIILNYRKETIEHFFDALDQLLQESIEKSNQLETLKHRFKLQLNILYGRENTIK